MFANPPHLGLINFSFYFWYVLTEMSNHAQKSLVWQPTTLLGVMLEDLFPPKNILLKLNEMTWSAQNNNGIPSRKLISKLIPPHPDELGVSKNEVMCADLDISCTSNQNNVLVKLPLIPLPVERLLNQSSLHFWTLNAISSKRIF